MSPQDAFLIVHCSTAHRLRHIPRIVGPPATSLGEDLRVAATTLNAIANGIVDLPPALEQGLAAPCTACRYALADSATRRARWTSTSPLRTSPPPRSQMPRSATLQHSFSNTQDPFGGIWRLAGASYAPTRATCGATRLQTCPLPWCATTCQRCSTSTASTQASASSTSCLRAPPPRSAPTCAPTRALQVQRGCSRRHAVTASCLAALSRRLCAAAYTSRACPRKRPRQSAAAASHLTCATTSMRTSAPRFRPCGSRATTARLW